MLGWMFENAVIALLMAGVVAVSCRFLARRPAVCHLLWLLVLVRLVAPPISLDHWPPKGLRTGVADAHRTVERAFGIESEVRSAAIGPTHHKTIDERRRASEARIRAEMEAARTEAGASGGDAKGVEGDRSEAEVKGESGYTASEPAVRTEREDSVSAGTSGRAENGGIGPGRIVLVVWGVGAAVALGVMAWRTGRFLVATRWATDAPAELMEEVARVSRSLGVRVPRVRLARGLGSPVVIGLGRTTLLWPGRDGGVDVPVCGGVIAHELAHVRRRDHWASWLEAGAGVIFWWNPVCWLARRRLRHYAELACDAWVVSTVEDRRAYAESLIGVAERFARVRSPSVALGATDSHLKRFEDRLRMIMRGGASCRLQPGLAALALALAMLALPTWTGARPFLSGAGQIEPVLERRIEATALEDRAVRAWDLQAWNEVVASYESLWRLRELRGAELHQLAYSLITTGDQARALEVLERQIASEFRVPTAHYNTACAHARSGRVAEALEHLRRAVEAGFVEASIYGTDTDLDPLRGQPDFRALMADVERASDLRSQAAEAERTGAWSRAAEMLERAAVVSPRGLVVLQRLGESQWRAGAHEQAAATMERMASIADCPPAHLVTAAGMIASTGDHERALSLVERAVERGLMDGDRLMDPRLDAVRGDARFAAAIARVGAVGKDLARAEAEGDWEAVIGSCGELALRDASMLTALEARALLTLGSALTATGDMRGAIGAYVKAAEAGEDLAEVLFRIARLYATAGDVETAIAHVEGAVRAGYANAGWLEQEPAFEGLRNDARFQRAVFLARDAEVLSMFRAVDWHHLERVSSEQVEADAEDGSAWLRLGWARLRTGKYEAAAEAFARQQSAGYATAIASYNLACAYSLAQQSDRAFEHLAEALRPGSAIDLDFASNDPDLEYIRRDPRFARVLADARNQRKGMAKDVEVSSLR